MMVVLIKVYFVNRSIPYPIRYYVCSICGRQTTFCSLGYKCNRAGEHAKLILDHLKSHEFEWWVLTSGIERGIEDGV